MYVHLQKYKSLTDLIYTQKYLQPIEHILYEVIDKYKNNIEFIQDIILLRELMIECDERLIKYYIGDEEDKHYIRIIEYSVTNDLRFLLFSLYNDVLSKNPIDDIPNVIVLEYCIFREQYIKDNIIDEDYGLDITEKDYLNNLFLPHPTEDDFSRYLYEKHYGVIQYNILNYMNDETLSQVVIDSIYEYQNELIEMCRNSINVEDIDTYTHTSSEFKLNILPSVAKQVIPLLSELIGIDLNISS